MQEQVCIPGRFCLGIVLGAHCGQRQGPQPTKLLLPSCCQRCCKTWSARPSDTRGGGAEGPLPSNIPESSAGAWVGLSPLPSAGGPLVADWGRGLVALPAFVAQGLLEFADPPRAGLGLPHHAPAPCPHTVPGPPGKGSQVDFLHLKGSFLQGAFRALLQPLASIDKAHWVMGAGGEALNTLGHGHSLGQDSE